MTQPIHISRPHRAWYLLLLACAGPLAAQATPPPRYLEIFREMVKVGRGGAHQTTEAGWPRAFGRAASKTSRTAPR